MRAAVARKRARWRTLRRRLDPGRLVFVDETWIKTNMAPPRGWTPRGYSLKGCAPPPLARVSLARPHPRRLGPPSPAENNQSDSGEARELFLPDLSPASPGLQKAERRFGGPLTRERRGRRPRRCHGHDHTWGHVAAPVALRLAPARGSAHRAWERVPTAERRSLAVAPGRNPASQSRPASHQATDEVRCRWAQAPASRSSTTVLRSPPQR